MGKAKNRGSLDERRLQADHRRRALSESLGLQQRPLGEIIGLPGSAVFHGYAVHLRESDEFLAGHADRNDSLMRGWSKGHAVLSQSSFTLNSSTKALSPHTVPS